MRIKQFTIVNYKSIGISQPCMITFPKVDSSGSSDFITIIGENNIGKSSILEALQLFLPETGTPKTPTIDMFPLKVEPSEPSKYMEITMIFDDFNDADRRHPYIKPYIFDDEMKIRRIWKGSNLKDSEVPFEVYIPSRVITELRNEPTWNARLFSNGNISDDLLALYEAYCKENSITNGTISKAKQEDFTLFVYLNKPELISEDEPNWMPNPNGIASKLRAIMPRVIYVPAVKLIDEEADANKSKSAANQITAALFDHHLNESPEIKNFKSSLESLKNIFNEDSRHQEVSKLEEELSKKLKRIMDVEANVDFDIPEVMEKLHLNSTIYLKHHNLITPPNQQGNGVQRMLILSLLELMAEKLTENKLDEENDTESWKRSFLFLIEEPEIYLHPHLQRKMRDSLVQISKHPLAQVMCTSHSENFIDLADRHQGIVLMKRSRDLSVSAIQVYENIYCGVTAAEKRARMRMLLNFNTSTLEAFFAKRVVLVEGDCEVASVIAIKNKLQKLYPDKKVELERMVKDISVIPCNGKLTQKAYFEVLSYFGVQPYLVHDLDNQAKDEGNNLIIHNVIGSEDFRLTHQPNFEEDIFNKCWDKDKPWKSTSLIENDFQTYQEKLLRFFKFVIGHENFDRLKIDSVASFV